MLAVNATLEPNIQPQSDLPVQQSQFRRISASAVRASEKVHYREWEVDYALSNEP